MTTTDPQHTANTRFVHALQRGLRDRGHYEGEIDGWAGAKTRAALEAALGWSLDTAEPAHPGLEDFRGDLDRVHAWEGHNGHPYWPGGASGVTLDPGFDLGQQTERTLRARYDFLGATALAQLAGLIGLRGVAARDAVRHRDSLARITVSREHAGRLFPKLAAPYWRAIVRRFPAAAELATPPAVQTVLLGLAFNRGAGNEDLAQLADPIRDGDWSRVADLIGDMQQTHRLAGIRSRRRQEASLIRSALHEGVTA